MHNHSPLRRAVSQLKRSIDRTRTPDLMSQSEWHRWFAWYPVNIATDESLAYWAWLEFVERKWGFNTYTGKWILRYRLTWRTRSP
jgi:hypothetical protein